VDTDNYSGSHHQQQHATRTAWASTLIFSQYLASSAGDTVVNKSVVVASVGIYEHDPVGLNGGLFQHQHDGGYVSYHHQHETSVVAGLVGA
jgi:hypothetical protein